MPLAKVDSYPDASRRSEGSKILSESDSHLDFNVTRCRYAEFYKELGLTDLGFQMHCGRDFAMVAGFNDGLELSRSQTIMEGGSCCDFRFRKRA